MPARALVATAVLAATVAAASATTPVRAQSVLVPQTPYSVFTRSGEAPIDGIATWVWPQAAPAIGGPTANYFYGFGFGFTNSSATVWMAFSHFSTGRSVFAQIRGPNGFAEDFIVPFTNWQVGHPYLMYFHRTTNNLWEALLYDRLAGMWTYVSPPFALPAEWGTISPASLTGMWLGAGEHVTCSGFPKTDVLIYPPIGFSLGTPIPASRVLDTTSAGTCPSQTTTENGWTRYKFGA